MTLKRIHYQGGLSQDRFFENGGGRRKPTLLRVKALLGDDSATQPRTFGLVIENDEPAPRANDDMPKIIPNLTLHNGGKSSADKS